MKTLHMPRIDPTMDKGVVLRWMKKEGEPVRKGEAVAVIMAEKVEYEYPSPYEGRVGRILVPEGQDVPVGAPIVEIWELGEAPPTPTAPAEPLASPAARRLARELGVDLREVVGTGPGGRITSEDVEAYVARRQTPAKPVVRLTPVMRIVAEKMVQSHREIPPVTLFIDISMDRVWSLRDQRGGPLDAYIIYATSRIMKDFPMVNAAYQAGELVLREDVNIAFAVAVGDELYTPVIKRASEKSFDEIRAEVENLAEKARNKRLSIDEVRDATFTITNLGPYGVEAFTPIIPPGQTAVLGIGAARERVVPKNGGIAVSRVATYCLTFDHRVLNGATAARFLHALKNQIENLSVD